MRSVNEIKILLFLYGAEDRSCPLLQGERWNLPTGPASAFTLKTIADGDTVRRSMPDSLGETWGFDPVSILSDS
jgi:hypothetical protein